jgi:2-methylcitrate dehydratase PrpD
LADANVPHSASRALAGFAAALRFDDLSQSVVHQTQRVILDTLGCTLGGVQHEVGVLSRRFVRDLGGSPDSVIVGTGVRTSCTNAAFVNANAANALDNDETFFNGAHPAALAVWAAIPLAEPRHLAGREVVAAVAAGYDVAARVALATEPPGVLGVKRKLVSSGSWQTFAAVAAAGRVIGLDEDGMMNAFGLAGTFAPMPAQTAWMTKPDRYSLVKYFPAGWAAQAGVTAAMLAAEGFTGPLDILDGETGFWRMQGFETCDFKSMVDGLGERFWIMDAAFKPWPACRAVHPYLTAFEMLLDENKLAPGEITSVTLQGNLPPLPSPDAPPNIAPRFAAVHPTEPINQQFNLPYAIACVAHRIPSGPRFYDPRHLADPAMRAFREKVVVKVDADSQAALQAQLSGDYPRRIRRVPVTVEVVARGKTYSRSTEYSKGDPWSRETILDDAALREKFVLNAIDLAGASKSWLCRIEQIMDCSLALDQMADIRTLTDLLMP